MEYAVKDYISNYTNVSNELTVSVRVGMNGTKEKKVHTHISVCLRKMRPQNCECKLTNESVERERNGIILIKMAQIIHAN